MARGFLVANGTITSNTDTAAIAAPGAGERIYIMWLTLTVSVAGTAWRVNVTDGVGGASIARFLATTADAMLNANYSTGLRDQPGRPLSVNTALNLTTSGSAAGTLNYEIGYFVK